VSTLESFDRPEIVHPTEAPGPARRPWQSPLDRLVVLVFVATLVVPAVAMAVGARPENLEARTLAAMPSVAPEALLDPAFYAAIDRFLADQFPLKAVAVQLHAALDYGVSGGSSNPDVLIGADDWLFFRGEVQPDCRFGAAELLATIDQVAAAGARLGIQVRFAITPDKHSIFPDKLGPAARLGTPCSDLHRDAVREGIAARPATAVDLWGPVLGLREARPDELVYWHQDSHWTPIGASPAIRALVEADAPGTWDESDIRIDGTLDRSAELARLIGLPRVEPAPRIVVERDNDLARTVLARPAGTGEGADGGPGERVVARYQSTGPDTVVPGTTLFVYDSFFGIYIQTIAPWYEDSIWVHVTDLRTNPEMVADFPAIDRVIFQVAEREAYRRPYVPILRPLLSPAP
jgi:hypothetical protein